MKIDPIIKIKKGSGIFVFFQDDDGKTTGTPSVRSPLTAVVATIESKLLADADMTATMGGEPVTGTEHETFFLIINDRSRISAGFIPHPSVSHRDHVFYSL